MEKHKTAEMETDSKKGAIHSIIVGIIGAFSVVYLLNPTMGVFELIPDNLPIIGNLDEAAAVALLISCLAYFGVDLGGLFGRKEKTEDDGIIDVEVDDR